MLALGVLPASAADPPANFQKNIRPVLEEHCFKCYNAGKHKGGIDLTRSARKARTCLANTTHGTSSRWKGRIFKSTDAIACKEVFKCPYNVECVAFGA
jgi:hypothetical protein